MVQPSKDRRLPLAHSEPQKGLMEAALPQDVWDEWLRKCKQREQETARKVRINSGISLSVLMIGTALYFLFTSGG